MKRRLMLGVGVLAAVAGAADAQAQTGGGAGSRFPALQRPVAPVVSYSWGDEASRDKDQEVAQIIHRLGLKKGMTVADIGAGEGYDVVRLARALGPGGRIIAEDLSKAPLAQLRRAAEQEHLAIETVVGTPGDPELPPGALDAAIMVHMYHEITEPYALLHHLAADFKPGGRLGVEELDRPTAAHGTPPALLICEMKTAGYTLQTMAPLEGRLGYFAVFSPRLRPRGVLRQLSAPAGLETGRRFDQRAASV